MAAVVPALIPAVPPQDPRMSSLSPMRRASLPLSRMPVVRDAGVVYGLATLDARGRVADRHVVLVLGWVPGLRLTAAVRQGSIVVMPDPVGRMTVAAPGHLRLPASVRAWCGLSAGDRVLLVALADQQRLVVHPPAVVDTVVAALHAAVLGGDAA